jgi:hypothetical protein
MRKEPPARHPMPLKSAIDQFIRLHKMQHKLDEVDVVQAWESCFPMFAKKMTTLIQLQQGGRLLLRLESAPLKEELGMQKTQLAERLNDHIGRKLVHEVVIQ